MRISDWSSDVCSSDFTLGGDPFDPRMNMIGGALYLAELASQFGFPGAYSAYNAGPGRYQRYVRRGVPLPSETVAYTAQITRGSPMPARSVDAEEKQQLHRWQEARMLMGGLPTPCNTKKKGER